MPKAPRLLVVKPNVCPSFRGMRFRVVWTWVSMLGLPFCRPCDFDPVASSCSYGVPICKMGTAIPPRGECCLLSPRWLLPPPLHSTWIGSGGRRPQTSRRGDRLGSQPHEINPDWLKPDMGMEDMFSSFVRRSMLGRGSLSK